MALVIDAVNLLHKDIYDGFVIVASDSDYTPLAINLHESGVYVIGVGEKKTPESFRNSCDEFVFLENLAGNTLKTASSNDSPESSTQNMLENAEHIEKNDDDIDVIHNLLKIASDKYQDDDGFVNVSAAGAFIKRAKPDFYINTYGYLKLPNLIEAYPEKYEMKRYHGKGKVTIVAYRCINEET